MTWAFPKRRACGAAAAVLLTALAGALAACGEARPTDVVVAPVPPAPVAMITMPPGRTPPPATQAPTPRVVEAVQAVALVTAAPTQAATAAATEAAPAAATPAVAMVGDAAAGQSLFTAKGCIACHGVDLSGGIGPKLAGRTTQDLSDARIREQAMQGGDGMPSFENSLTEPELMQIIAFIRSQ